MKSIGKLFLISLTVALLAHSRDAAAANYVLDQPTCEMTFGGVWVAGATDVCNSTNLEVMAGDALSVPAGTELNVAGDGVVHGVDPFAGFPAAVLDIETSADLVIVGVLTNRGIVNIDGDAVVTGSFGNEALGIVELNGELTNHGELSNNASWFVMQTGELESQDTVHNQDYGTFSIIGTVTITDGSMTNYHHVVNSGGSAILTIEVDASFDNLNGGTLLMNFGGGRIGNHGTLNNGLGAQVTNNGGSFANTGTVVNYADAIIDNLNSGLIANLPGGLIENQDGGIMRNRAMIHNIGEMENYCAATFINFASGVVSNVMFVGRFTNFGGTLNNSGVFFTPAVQQACVFKP